MSAYRIGKPPLGRRAGLASSVPMDETARAVGCLWHESRIYPPSILGGSVLS
jgi:hypothetical protein